MLHGGHETAGGTMLDGTILLHRACPKCGQDNAATPALGYSWQEWTLRACGGCGFVYLENPPDYAALAVDFAWERNHGDRADRMKKEYPLAFNLSRIWRRIRRAVLKKPDKLANRIRAWVPPGPVVEVGCGTADRLAALPADYETMGIEISEALAREARANLSVRSGSIINMPADRKSTRLTSSH